MSDNSYTGLLAVANGWKARAEAAEAERDALAAHVERLTDRLGKARDAVIEATPDFDTMIASCDEILATTPTTSLARRDAEQFRQGFWWGFERARCHPDQMNIRAEFEDVQELRRVRGEQAGTAGEVSR
ncbi:hypothetical protein [Halomonas koreensis]|uniref:Uncharacterized protein n=1 Tax=Halomonas koreensis TaxID=245385 RepID=A0ABU1G427_9GAMM|nr:hypothetical protein [Halomonas koreensis]MDR5867252.1 hypothetical protein [Halomonas koreensis]